jgi:hypothetical protein
MRKNIEKKRNTEKIRKKKQLYRHKYSQHTTSKDSYELEIGVPEP